MALTENTFEVKRALAGAGAVRQAVSNFGHIARATKVPVLNPHLHGALSLGARLGMASGIVANSGRTTPAIAKSNRPDSSLYDDPAKLEKTGRRHHSSKAPGRDSSSANFKAFLDIFASMCRSLVVSPSHSRLTHQGNPVHRDDAQTDPLVAARQGVAPLLRQFAAPFTPVLRRALVRGVQIINGVAEFLKNNTIVSTLTKLVVYVLGALWVLGSKIKFIKGASIESLQEGLRLSLSPSFAFRWLVTTANFGAMLAALRLTSYFVLRALLAAIAVALDVAAYELYRHWDAAKRLLSRWISSADKTVAHLIKWIADTFRSAAAYAANSIASVTAILPNASRALDIGIATSRDVSRTRAVEHAAGVALTAPTLHAVRRTTTAVALAAPLIFASSPSGAFASSLIPNTSTGRRAISLSGARIAQHAIVINFAPQVTIHSEDAADPAALKRRVMEILERHGRELHQALQREIVRQQRRDFQTRPANQQG
jgi:hypothetical protein